MRKPIELSFEQFLEIWNAVKRDDPPILFPFKGHYHQVREEKGIPAIHYEKKIELNRWCLHDLLKNRPKDLKNYVLQGERASALGDREVLDSVVRYEYIYSLWMVFLNLTGRLRMELEKTIPIRGFNYSTPAIALINISEDLVVSVQHLPNIFDGLDLKRLKQCETCQNYYYAAKVDKRNKFCSDTCRNKIWEANPANKAERNKQRREKYKSMYKS